MASSAAKRSQQDDPASTPAPSAKRTCFDSPSPFPVDKKSVASQLPSPDVTEKLDDLQATCDRQETHNPSNPSAHGDDLAEPHRIDQSHTGTPLDGLKDLEGRSQKQTEQAIHDWLSRSLTPDHTDTELISFEGPIASGSEASFAKAENMPPLKRVPSQDLALHDMSFNDGSEGPTSVNTLNNFYTNPTLPTLFNQHGIYLEDNQKDINTEEMKYCKELLKTPAPNPFSSPLDDKSFQTFFGQCQYKSESWQTSHLLPHLFLPPELLSTRGVTACQGLISGSNDAWTRACYKWKRPQPDFTIAFKWDQFSDEERRKLRVFAGATSPYLARDDMYFPHFTREAKAPTQSINVAERQNAHSMSVAAEGYIHLFHRANRLGDLSGRVYGLSMAHDTDNIRINAHYVIITTSDTKISVKKCQAQLGQFYWDGDIDHDWRTPIRFINNVYDKFSERHLKWIKEAIAGLPDPADELPQSVASVNDVQQNADEFKKPRNSTNADLRKQIDTLVAQIQKLHEHIEKQREDAQKQREDAQKQREDAQKQREDAQKQREDAQKQREDAQKRESELLGQLKAVTALLGKQQIDPNLEPTMKQ